MTEFPESIAGMFKNEPNPACIYSIKFYVNGIETIVTVDDYIPTRYGKPAFSKAKGDEIWVCLVEKAWAKLCGTYVNAEGASPTWAG